MAKALDYPVVFKALLDGGDICRILLTGKEIAKITVHTPARSTSVGHITENQFIQLLENNIIELEEQPVQSDKYGNMYSYYTIYRKKEGIR